MFSFGHCPNYLSPLPFFRATCTSFSAVIKEYIKCIFQFGQGPPPSFGQCTKENIFFYMRCSLMFHRIASLSKRVTEMTVLALLDRGLLDLDSKVIFWSATIGGYIPIGGCVCALRPQGGGTCIFQNIYNVLLILEVFDCAGILGGELCQLIHQVKTSVWKITVRGTMVRYKVCNSWCYC